MFRYKINLAACRHSARHAVAGWKMRSTSRITSLPVCVCVFVYTGQTSATSEQRTTGDGQQTNQGQASAVSTQQQTGLGGATQTTNNQGVIQALQQAGGGNSGGGGGGTQSSNNQVNIVTNQEQQNVEGTLINVHGGNEGTVIVNTNEGGG